jgi:hypothetical protein
MRLVRGIEPRLQRRTRANNYRSLTHRSATASRALIKCPLRKARWMIQSTENAALDRMTKSICRGC